MTNIEQAYNILKVLFILLGVAICIESIRQIYINNKKGDLEGKKRNIVTLIALFFGFNLYLVSIGYTIVVIIYGMILFIYGVCLLVIGWKKSDEIKKTRGFLITVVMFIYIVTSVICGLLLTNI